MAGNLDGRARNLAVSALAEANFTTDGAGAPLAAPVSMLIAATWNLAGNQMVYSRDDSTGAWSAATLVADSQVSHRLAQVRAFGQHRDRVTGVDMVFAGDNPHGIFSGVYDPGVPGRIRWSRAPEFSPGPILAGEFPGLQNPPRVTSFAECNGRLYAAVGQQIYERVDGANPDWRLVYTNPDPGYSLSPACAASPPSPTRRAVGEVSAGGGGRNARPGSCESTRAQAPKPPSSI